MENNSSNSGNKESGVELNPELCELKRQLCEGFEQMIEPLKHDIISRKFKNNDERH